VFSNVQRPPAAQPGELWLVHGSGSYVKLTNDGTIQMAGNLHVQGEISDLHGTMTQIRTVHNQHVHTDSRNGLTTQPNIQD
jgi:hypothetical protein